MRPTHYLSRHAVLAGLGTTVVAATLAACATSGNSGSKSGGAVGEGDASQADVATWWSVSSEKFGLDTPVKVFSQQFLETKFGNKAVSDGADSQTEQKPSADLAAENPPDTYQAHAGAKIKDHIEAGHPLDVSNLHEEFKLNGAFPATLMDRLKGSDGKIYSVPSNIHWADVARASVSALKAAGLDPTKPVTITDVWIADMEEIKAAGLIPIAMGMAWAQLELLETILIANLGVDTYNGLLTGKIDWGGAEVTKVLGHYKTTVDFTDSSLYIENWEPATKPTMDGKAAFNVTGDWAVAGFDAVGKKAGQDHVYFPVPGTDGVLDSLADSFTLPDGAEHPGGAKNQLSTISSKDGQTAFNTVKGFIPTRTGLIDEDKGKFSEYQRTAMESFAKDKIVFSTAHGATLSTKATNAMNDALTKFVRGVSDVTALQADLEAAAAS